MSLVEDFTSSRRASILAMRSCKLSSRAFCCAPNRLDRMERAIDFCDLPSKSPLAVFFIDFISSSAAIETPLIYVVPPISSFKVVTTSMMGLVCDSKPDLLTVWLYFGLLPAAAVLPLPPWPPDIKLLTSVVSWPGSSSGFDLRCYRLALLFVSSGASLWMSPPFSKLISSIDSLI